MPMRIGTELPSLEGATEWLNGTASREAALGRPALIHFWSVSCGICSEQMPCVIAWLHQYAARGLSMVGVHMPRSERDCELEAVRHAVREYGIEHPVAVDNTHTIVDAFANQFVPAFYLFDHEGHLRQFAAGENAVGLLDKALERVLNAYEESSALARAVRKGDEPRSRR